MLVPLKEIELGNVLGWSLYLPCANAPVSSVLSPRENGLPALEVPRPPDPPEGGKGGPMSWGRTAYSKIQIESDPMGASIMLDGERHGTTPETIVMQRSEIKLILRKPGFLDTASEI